MRCLSIYLKRKMKKMSNEEVHKSNNSMFIIITGILLAVGRYSIDKVFDDTVNQNYILIIMAILNFVALGFVLLILCNGLSKDCFNRIEKAGIFTDKRKKCKKILNGISLCLSLIYLVFGVIYIKNLRSSAWNDIFSIIALSISIANDGIIEDYGSLLYKLVLKISEVNINKKLRGN